MSNKKKIISISANVPVNKKIYVKGLERRDDKLYRVTTTFNPDEAKDFISRKIAQQMIPELYNPFDRIDTIDPVQVNKHSYAMVNGDLN